MTTSELAVYWKVSRKQIYKQIGMGALKAVRFGPRLFRISIADAIEFERLAKMTPEPKKGSKPPDGRNPTMDQRPGHRRSAAKPPLRRR